MSSDTDGQRIVALDALRGLAVAGMIVVTSPGAWEHSYAPLMHAAWNGWTPADLVFPTFLFCVGLAIGLSMPGLSATDRASPAVWIKFARRTALLVLLGLILNALPTFDLAHLRFPGILQRIGLCYALGCLICLPSARTGPDGMLRLDAGVTLSAAVALLIGYWALLAFTPVPGFGVGRLDTQGSLPAFVDRAVFTVPHLWVLGLTEGVGVTYDPEGLLSTLPATVNVLIGAVAALLLRQPTDSLRPGRAAGLALVLGVALIVAGLALDPLLPINKRIWTPSFALFSSGVALTALAVLHALLAFRVARIVAWPLKVLGGNAILVFVISQVMGAYSSLALGQGPDGAVITPQAFGYALAQRLTHDLKLASLLCALGVLTLIICLVAPLHRRGIHLRL